jgi:hypothetical protein
MFWFEASEEEGHHTIVLNAIRHPAIGESIEFV